MFFSSCLHIVCLLHYEQVLLYPIFCHYLSAHFTCNLNSFEKVSSTSACIVPACSDFPFIKESVSMEQLVKAFGNPVFNVNRRSDFQMRCWDGAHYFL